MVLCCVLTHTFSPSLYRPGIVYTLQALSDEDRKLWMDVMDGKEPVNLEFMYFDECLCDMTLYKLCFIDIPRTKIYTYYS